MPTLHPAKSESAWRVFLVFLRLGLTSFGGPIAHLSYFRLEFVERRRWLTDRSYSDLVALCQLLPGPASSQVGMALGLARAGWLGLLAAWAGFTLPSAVLMILFGFGVARYQGILESGWLHGLKIVAVAVVAQAVWGMARTLCPDRLRAGMALVAAVLTLALPSVFGQMVVIICSGLLGRWALKIEPAQGQLACSYPVSRRTGSVALMLLVLPLVLLPVWVVASGSPLAVLLEGTYRAGALVFGGGHVVLPLLQTAVVQSGTVTTADLLAGYGAAQAVPGPLFTFAAYLGAWPRGRWVAGLEALCCWQSFSCQPFLCSWGRCRSGRPCATERVCKLRLLASTPGWSGFCWLRCTTRCGRVRSMTDGMPRWRWLRSGYWPSRVHRRSWLCCWLP